MTAGGYRTRCGWKWRSCCRPGPGTPWVATTCACQIVLGWTRSFSCCEHHLAPCLTERRSDVLRMFAGRLFEALFMRPKLTDGERVSWPGCPSEMFPCERLPLRYAARP